MAASVIFPRSIWTDDSGTAVAPVGDGTIINNAALQNDIYARIDALFMSHFTIGGRFTAEGFGTHTYSAGGSGTNQIAIRNTTAGTGNYASVALGNNATAQALLLFASSATYTAAGDAPQDGALLRAERVGGLTISASHASGAIRFFTAAVEHMKLWPSGGLDIGYGGDPGTGSVGLGTTVFTRAIQFDDIPTPTPVADVAILHYNTTSQRLQLANDGGASLNVVVGEGCGLYHSGAQSIIGDGTYRALTFDSEDFDDNGLHSTGTNPTRVTIVQTGKYLFIGHSGDLPTNAGSRLGFRIGGSAVTGDVEQGDNQDRMMTSGIYALAAGQYIELVARHPTTTGNWGSSTRAQAAQFMATRVG